MVFSSSVFFMAFLPITVLVYFLIPERFLKIRNLWLLLASLLFYGWGEPKYIAVMAFSIVFKYVFGRVIGRLRAQADEQEALLAGAAETEAAGRNDVAGSDENSSRQRLRRAKLAMVLCVIGNLAILGFFKYTDFLIGTVNGLLGGQLSLLHIALPIGISFYTFQSVGYILDVYWKRYEPEKNIFKFALFVSFFSQILQGPIGRYSTQAHQFYEEHSFDFMRIERGVQRVLWGFFKKMVIADTAAVFVDAIFDQYQTYNGLAILGVLAYSAQLYGDFSGGMDVVIGIASMFGLEMDENFKRPYFSISITDFWHRWHITLGTWMKDYLFYPLSLSKGMGKFGKFAKKTFGKTYGRALPICVANIVVFLVVGIWHGAAWKFIVYGLYNGIIIGFSGLMAKNYRDWKKKFKINDKSNGWHIFQIVRTFILVNISWFFDRADTIPQALTMMKNAVTVWKPVQVLDIRIGTSGPAYTIMAIGILCIGCLVQFIVSYKQERGMQIRESIAMQPRLVRWAVYMALVLSISAISLPANTAGGFIYAQF